MSPPSPEFLFVFANDRGVDGNYLRNLPTEMRETRSALEPLAERGECSLIELPNAVHKDVFDKLLGARRDRIEVFHFAGHAGGAAVMFETSDGRPSRAHARGLAQILGGLPSLQLVFLNGCATEDHAASLLRAGVPTVIVTSQEIRDDVAAELAKRFYQGLAAGRSIRCSFEDATSVVTTRLGPSPRDAYRRSFAPDVGEKLDWPWILYPEKGTTVDAADPASLVLLPAPDSEPAIRRDPPAGNRLPMDRLIEQPKTIFPEKVVRSDLSDKLLAFARERDIVFALGGAGSGLNTFTRQFREHLGESGPVLVESADLEPEHFEQIEEVREAAERIRWEAEVQQGAIVHLELKCLLTALAYDIYDSLRSRFPGEIEKGLGGRHFTDPLSFSDYYSASADSEAMYKTDPVPIMKHFFETIQSFAEMTKVQEVLVLMPWPRLARCFRNNADSQSKNLGRALWKALGDLVAKLARPLRTSHAQAPSAFPSLDIYDKVCLIVCCSEVPYAHHAQKQRNLVARCIWPIPPLGEHDIRELVSRTMPSIEADLAAAEIISWTGGAPWFVRLLMSYLFENSRRITLYDDDVRYLIAACAQSAMRALEASGERAPGPISDFIRRHQQAVEEALGSSQSADDSLIEQSWAGPLHEVSDGYRIRPYRLEAFVASGLIWLEGDPWDAKRDDYVFRRYPTVFFARARELPLAMYRSVTGNDVRISAY